MLPDVLQELLAVEGAPGGGAEEEQQLQLRGGEGEFRTPLVDDERVSVDLQVADPGRAGGRARGVLGGGDAAQHRAHPRLDDRGAGRLDDVVVGAPFKADDDVEVVAACGQDHQGDLAGLTDAAAHLQAAHSRQHQIQEHEVGLDGLQRLQTVLTGADGLRLVAHAVQAEHDAAAYGRVVLDQQDAGHGRDLPGSERGCYIGSYRDAWVVG